MRWNTIAALAILLLLTATHAWAGQSQTGTDEADIIGVEISSAAYVSSNADYVYSVADGTVEITEYKGTGGDVVVPGTIDGFPVTAIGNNVFAFLALTAVTFPDSVTSIGWGAFRSCSSLASADLGTGLISIDDYAFYNCEVLTHIDLPGSLAAIGYRAFGACDSLTDITVDPGNPVYSSQDGILYNKGKTALVICPGGKTGAITIPGSVNTIENNAFYDCIAVTEVSIPNSVTYIGEYAFAYCSALTSVDIPDSVTSIGSYAFYGCTALAGAVIPDSVTSIKAYAFGSCTSLTAITIPGSVTSVENGIFSYCSSLTSVTIPESITSLSYAMFRDCYALHTVTLPDTLTHIGAYAFTYCNALTNITIPDSVTSIGDFAFHACSTLTSIDLPDGVTIIGKSIFRNCRALTSVTLGNSINAIGDYAFYGCWDLADITLPNTVTTIGWGAFENCDSLAGITIPDSVIAIEDHAFYSCDSLSNVTLGSSVTRIGQYAFYNCIALTSIQFPESLTLMEYAAFRNCSSLSTAYFLGDAPVIEDIVFQSAAPDFTICYAPGSTGFTSPFWQGYRAEECVCLNDSHCPEGYACNEGVCEMLPNPSPSIDSGPFLTAGTWPLLRTDADSPSYLKQDQSVLWTFDDDYTTCSGLCTHEAQYNFVVGSDPDESTRTLTVNTDPTGQWYAWVDLPIEDLPNETTYALRFAVTDCAGQSTHSGDYFFRTAIGIDTPPEIMNGPFAAAGTWPRLPRWWKTDEAPVFSQITNILWTFTDDYLNCAEVCTHRARYRRDDGSAEQHWVWTELTITTDPTGKEYAYAEIPVDSLENGTYWFWFDVTDCEGQRSYSKVYVFKVLQAL